MLFDSTSEEHRTYEGVSREEVREKQKSVDRWWEHPGWSKCDMMKLFEEPPKHWVCGVCEARVDADCARILGSNSSE